MNLNHILIDRWKFDILDDFTHMIENLESELEGCERTEGIVGVI